MHKLIRVLTSRLFLVGALVIAQFLLIIAYVYNFTFTHSLFPALQVIGIFLSIYVVNRTNDPAYKISWVFIILFSPLVGVPLYFMFGNKKISKKLYNGTLNGSKVLKELLVKTETKHIQAEDNGQLFRFGREYCGFPVYEHTKTTYFSSGEEWFPVYLEKLRSAKKYIFLEMFIIDYGKVWDEVLEILKQKVQEGVDVKVIFDDFGCVTMHAHLEKELRKLGIDAHGFNRLRPALIIQMNNRDHRKITVIDNEVGFTGGVNLADEYINHITRFGYWKDSALMVEGPAVWSMASQFLGMYHYLSKNPADTDYSMYCLPCKEYDVEGYVQPFADSPTDDILVGMSEHLNLIHHAKKYIYINTPYLILNDAISRALKVASESGVDVRILVPHIPDKKLVFQITRHSYKALIESGIKIYEFTPGFNHSKAIVCDDEYGLVGSINTDFRSYFLHFEDAVLMYKTVAVKDVKEDFLQSLEKSHEVTMKEVNRTPLILKIIRAILTLFIPLV